MAGLGCRLGQSSCHRIVDSSTGQTVVLGAVPQDDLSEKDAAHTAKMLNDRVARGDRKVLD